MFRVSISLIMLLAVIGGCSSNSADPEATEQPAASPEATQQAADHFRHPAANAAVDFIKNQRRRRRRA
ncbi:hypothetical protein D3C80_2100340 [compost metagenome]